MNSLRHCVTNLDLLSYNYLHMKNMRKVKGSEHKLFLTAKEEGSEYTSGEQGGGKCPGREVRDGCQRQLGEEGEAPVSCPHLAVLIPCLVSGDTRR